MWDERVNDENSGNVGQSGTDTPDTGFSFNTAGDMTEKQENSPGTTAPENISSAAVVNPFADAHSWNTGKYAGTNDESSVKDRGRTAVSGDSYQTRDTSAAAFSGSGSGTGFGANTGASESSGGFSNGGYTYSTRTDTSASGAGSAYSSAGAPGSGGSGAYSSAGAPGSGGSGAYGSSGAPGSGGSGAFGSAGAHGSGGAYGSAGAAGRNPSYGGSAGPSGTSGPDASAGTGGRGTNAVGTGRYYDYSRNSSGNNGGAGNGSGRRGKAKGRLAAILAVILFFILGAGAGAYISSRGSISTTSSSAGAESKTEGSARVEEKTGKDNSQEVGSTPAEKKDADESTPVSTESLFSENPSIRQVEAVDAQAAGVNTVVADVAENVMPAIVSVFNKYTEEAQFFGHPYTQENESTGSGIIIGESDGEILIVTNNHVVEGADSLSVQFIDEENCQAALKGTNAASDLAVIAVKLSDLSDQTKNSIAIAGLGDSNSLRIGEQVIAIGNALGYGQSVTVGYVSALNREFSEEDGITGTFIQTDAAINPGNSGGALLNAEGKVVGINSNKIGGNAIEGMGFAIPISKAIPIIDDLKMQESKTKVAEEERGVLGIRGISVTSDVASAYNMPVGAYVEEVIEGSGAADSNLVKGDVIIAVNGTEVTSMESLATQLSYYSAGTEVTLTIKHPVDGGDYEEREVKVVLSKASDLPTQESRGDMGEQQQGQLEEGIPDESTQGLFPFMFGF